MKNKEKYIDTLTDIVLGRNDIEWKTINRFLMLRLNKNIFPFITFESKKAWSKKEFLALEVEEKRND